MILIKITGCYEWIFWTEEYSSSAGSKYKSDHCLLTSHHPQEANYGTNRIWTNNPTFLLSGQLTGEILLQRKTNYSIMFLGFDPIETRHRTRHYVHESHIYSWVEKSNILNVKNNYFSPDRIFSTFDNPASITVISQNFSKRSMPWDWRCLVDGSRQQLNILAKKIANFSFYCQHSLLIENHKIILQVTMRNWAAQSHIYLIFTSYKLVRKGQTCRGGDSVIISLIYIFWLQREQSTSVPLMNSSSRRMVASACLSAWPVMVSPTVERILFLMLMKPASRSVISSSSSCYHVSFHHEIHYESTAHVWQH